MSDHFDDEIRAAVGPPDMTNQYNTRLSRKDEALFQRSPTAKDVFDYDARGEFISGQNRDNPTGHGSDTFKKPNHPTFSNESKYHGVDGHVGGTWGVDADGKDTYTPSPTNLKMHSL